MLLHRSQTLESRPPVELVDAPNIVSQNISINATSDQVYILTILILFNKYHQTAYSLQISAYYFLECELKGHKTPKRCKIGHIAWKPSTFKYIIQLKLANIMLFDGTY